MFVVILFQVHSILIGAYVFSNCFSCLILLNSCHCPSCWQYGSAGCWPFQRGCPSSSAWPGSRPNGPTSANQRSTTSKYRRPVTDSKQCQQPCCRPHSTTTKAKLGSGYNVEYSVAYWWEVIFALSLNPIPTRQGYFYHRDNISHDKA